ncbi:hypothetical protein MTO96_023424 [Rhipicephalus appendiculatus]
MSLARFWRRKVLRRADDDGPVYVLDLNSHAASVEALDTPGAVHYGEKVSAEGRSVLILSVVVALLTVLAVGFALGVIFRENAPLPALEPITDFGYKRAPIGRQELSKPLARYKASTDATVVGGQLKKKRQFSPSS